MSNRNHRLNENKSFLLLRFIIIQQAISIN